MKLIFIYIYIRVDALASWASSTHYLLKQFVPLYLATVGPAYITHLVSCFMARLLVRYNAPVTHLTI